MQNIPKNNGHQIIQGINWLNELKKNYKLKDM